MELLEAEVLLAISRLFVSEAEEELGENLVIAELADESGSCDERLEVVAGSLEGAGLLPQLVEANKDRGRNRT